MRLGNIIAGAVRGLGPLACLFVCLLLFSALRTGVGKDPASESGGVLSAPSSWTMGFIGSAPLRLFQK